MFLKKLDVPLSLTFDDVLLEPQASWIEPSEAETATQFTKNIGVKIPLVSAAMDTVTESTMAIALAREGGIGVIHRNMTPERELQEVQFVKRAEELIVRDVLYVEEGQRFLRPRTSCARKISAASLLSGKGRLSGS